MTMLQAKQDRWIDIDRGMKGIEREIKRLARIAVTVGVHGIGETGKNERGETVTVGEHIGPGKNDEPIAMPQLAAIHEFGAGDNMPPERSFLRAGVDREHKKIAKAYDIGVDRILEGKGTAKLAGELIGVVAVGAVRMQIFDGLQPDLAEVTKKRRDKSKLTGKRLKSGNDKQTGYQPLLDTGQLAGSIAYQVDTLKGGR